MKRKTALIIVDLQNEYVNGKLQIPHIQNIIKKINIITNKFDIVCYTKNVFPNKNKKDRKNIKISDSGYYCVEGTYGSQINKNLKINDNIFIRSYNKGFSAALSKKDEINIKDFLNENNVTDVFICGVPGDYAIKYTSLDLSKNFKTYIIIDLVKTIGKMNDFVNFLLDHKIQFFATSDLNFINNKIKLNKIK